MRYLSKALALVIAVMMVMSLSITTAFASGSGNPPAPEEQATLTNEEKAWIRDHIRITESGAITSDALGNNVRLRLEVGGETDIPCRGGHVKIKAGTSVADIKRFIANAGSSGVDLQDNVSGLFDTQADTEGAAELLSGFMPIVQLLLGVMIVGITAGMTVFTAFDVAYIAFPVFRNKCEEAKASGKGTGLASDKKTPSGENKLRFVTDDAQQAIAETAESGKSPWGIYFKKRVVSYVLLAIVLFILLTGNISLITNIAINVVSGIMNVLSGLAT